MAARGGLHELRAAVLRAAPHRRPRPARPDGERPAPAAARHGRARRPQAADGGAARPAGGQPRRHGDPRPTADGVDRARVPVAAPPPLRPTPAVDVDVDRRRVGHAADRSVAAPAGVPEAGAELRLHVQRVLDDVVHDGDRARPRARRAEVPAAARPVPRQHAVRAVGLRHVRVHRGGARQYHRHHAHHSQAQVTTCSLTERSGRRLPLDEHS